MGRLRRWLKQKIISVIERAIAPWKAEVNARLDYESGRIDGVISQEDKDARQARAAAAELAERASRTEGHIDILQVRADGLEASREALQQRAESLESSRTALQLRTDGLELYTQQLAAEDAALAGRVNNLKAILSWANNEDFLRDLAGVGKVESADNELFYHDFEERFRGPQEQITARQRQYLPLLRGALGGLSGARCVDIGCGRGEWLDILCEENAVYTGVDLNSLQLEICRGKGHPVEQADAITWLAAQPANSLDLVTAFQLIEHLPFETLLNLFAVCHRALRPGGAILFETPNNANLQTGATYFYSDPTHNRPLFKGTIGFIAEHSGFCNVQIIESSPGEPADMLHTTGGGTSGERNVDILNRLLFGPQDYAVFGVKETMEQTGDGNGN